MSLEFRPKCFLPPQRTDERTEEGGAGWGHKVWREALAEVEQEGGYWGLWREMAPEQSEAPLSDRARGRRRWQDRKKIPTPGRKLSSEMSDPSHCPRAKPTSPTSPEPIPRQPTEPTPPPDPGSCNSPLFLPSEMSVSFQQQISHTYSKGNKCVE